MPILKDDVPRLVEDLKKDLLSSLEGHNDFLDKIYDESDWAYIVKAHTLLEVTVTESILAQVGDERLKKVIERLPLSDEQIGKIELGKDLGILSKKQRSFIKAFSQLRNAAAHRIENLNLDLKAYYEALDPQQKKSFANSIMWSELDDKGKNNLMSLIRKDPKIVIHMFLFSLLGVISISSSEAKCYRNLRDLALETSEAMLKQLNPEKPNKAGDDNSE